MAAAEPGPFGVTLQRYRLAAGLSQEELAEQAGLSRRGISDLERGARRAPHPATVRRLAQALGLDHTQRAALSASAQEPARQPRGGQAAPEAVPTVAELPWRARVEARLTQEALAERAGLSGRAISDLERGIHGFPSLNAPGRRIEALGVVERERARLDLVAQRLGPPAATAGAGANTRAHHNLPLQLTSFIGRVLEMADIRRELANARLLTLSGPGGVGKTRLALRVAEEELASYPDGVWFVDLAPLVEPTLVPQLVASVLGIRENPGEVVLTTLTRALRPLQLLLILDNCEHLLAACVELVDTLLRGCPQVRVLTTSREVLGIGAEQVWRVPPLGLPDPQHPPAVEQLAHCEAVRLFVERARAAVPAFDLTDATATGVAEVCQRLDGIPLAIELAAARVKVLSPGQIAERLDDRFQLLTGGSRTALPRHQTLRALVDWSYALLNEQERALLRRLSVFAGGCTLDAAEAVGVGAPIERADVLDLLSQLVDKSLVLAEPGAQGGMRYRLLAALRQFSAEHLRTSGDGPRTYGQHRDWYLALAEAAEPELWGPRQLAWAEGLDTELDNVRAALDFCKSASDPEPGLRLAGALWHYWGLRGRLTEGREWLTGLLARADPAAPSSARARALASVAYLSLWLGDYPTTISAAQASRQLARELGDTWAVAFSVGTLGLAAYFQGEPERATALLEETLRLAQHLAGERAAFIVRSTLVRLGNAAAVQGDYPRAAAVLEEGLAQARQCGDLWTATNASNNLARLARRRGELERARTLGCEALPLYAEFQDWRLAGLCLLDLALVATAEGAPARAAQLLGAAETTLGLVHAERLLPRVQELHDQCVAELRQALGEAGFEAAVTAGRARSAREAIGYALAVEQPVSAPRPA